ncbi:MAG: methionine biosynthesis protein MetW, partial [Hyphomicrobiales bacterium]|nr:methionine biosynthesis protein MetW [Hyphomicrobiales bacterium]
PADVLEQMLRIGKYAIVSFPNFAYWRVRTYLALRGRMPVTPELPYAWYETPNTHFCTILDFISLSRNKGYVIEKTVAFDNKGHHRFHEQLGWRANLFAQNALFLLRKD